MKKARPTLIYGIPLGRVLSWEIRSIENQDGDRGDSDPQGEIASSEKKEVKRKLRLEGEEIVISSEGVRRGDQLVQAARTIPQESGGV